MAQDIKGSGIKKPTPTTLEASKLQQQENSSIAPELHKMIEEQRAFQKSEEALKNIGEILRQQRAISVPNPHDVVSYKQTSDGKSEIIGPLTLEAFRAYRSNLSPQTESLSDIERTSVRSEFEAISKEIDRIAAGHQGGDSRFLIQSETDEKGEMKAKRILSGHYEEGANKKIHIDTIFNLETGQQTNVRLDFRPHAGFFLEAWPLDRNGILDSRVRMATIPPSHGVKTQEPTKQDGVPETKNLQDQSADEIPISEIPVSSRGDFRQPVQQETVPSRPPQQKKGGLVIPLSDTGALLQPEANNLVAKLHDLPVLDIVQPNKTSDGKTTLQASYISDSRAKVTGDRLIRDLDAALTEPDPTTKANTMKAYNLSMDMDRVLELDILVDNRNFTRTLAITHTDPGGKETHRILLGKVKGINGTDRVTGQPIETISFTESFNVDNGKASPLETPIELPVTGNRTRQENIEDVAEKVRQAVEKKEISMLAPKGGNPEFDRLIKQAQEVELTHNTGGPVSRSGKTVGVA